MDKITVRQALDYEIKSTRWMQFVSCGFIQGLISSYMARKISAKHNRYLEYIELSERVQARNANKTNATK